MEYEDNSNGGISLLDAIEALSSIVETPWEKSDYEFAEEINWKDPGWLKNGNKEEVVLQIKNIFKVILSHLKTCYHDDEGTAKNTENVEGIKNIMLIVGEAAKKIDRYTDLFHTRHVHSILETREYKQLQNFYRKTISGTIDEALLGKWILGLTERAFHEREKIMLEEKLLDTKHVYVDMDSVKNDSEYELFFIRKEDGSRFFSPRLIRNITLICDFGFQLGQEKDNDPLIDLSFWSDRYGHGLAKGIMEASGDVIHEQYPLIIHHKELPFCASVHKAVLALYLASSQERLLSSGSSKGCLSYFRDFQMYLREALASRTYQYMIAYPNQEFAIEERAAKKIVDEILKLLFEMKISNERLDSYIRFIVTESNSVLSEEHTKAINLDHPVWSRLACDYAAMQKFMKRHPNGPLNKVLHLIEEGDFRTFDPYSLQRLPETLFKMDLEGKSTAFHSIASPTMQETINQATTIHEWLGYLRTKAAESGNIVIFDYQDNTSWREYARAKTLEKLQEATEFEKVLSVTTLPKDTEFYHQDVPYQDDHQLATFKQNLISQLLEEHTGFYFPPHLKSYLSVEWISGVFNAINKLFFSGKNVLSRESRRDFIEIFYGLLELKILNILHPSDVFLTCKDGVDISPTAGAQLFVLIKALKGETISPEELESLTVSLYKPALLSRERVLLPARAERMLSAIKVIESASRNSEDEFKAMAKKLLAPFVDYE